MRWELDGPNLIVMPDTPYLRVLQDRLPEHGSAVHGAPSASPSQISSGAAAGGAGGGGAAAGAAGNTSSTTLRNKSDQQVLGNPGRRTSRTSCARPTSCSPAFRDRQECRRPRHRAAAPAQAGQPAGAGAAACDGTAQAANVNFREAASVIANPESGVLSIRATSRQHEKIQEFLDQVLSSAKRQVLIEATIAEVQLNNHYQQGIDWSLVRHGGPGSLNVAQSVQGTSLAGSQLEPARLELRRHGRRALRCGCSSPSATCACSPARRSACSTTRRRS